MEYSILLSTSSYYRQVITDNDLRPNDFIIIIIVIIITNVILKAIQFFQLEVFHLQFNNFLKMLLKYTFLRFGILRQKF